MALRVRQFYGQTPIVSSMKMLSHLFIGSKSSNFDEVTVCARARICTFLYYLTTIDRGNSVANNSSVHNHEMHIQMHLWISVCTIGNRERRLFDLMKSTEMVEKKSIYTRPKCQHIIIALQFFLLIFLSFFSYKWIERCTEKAEREKYEQRVMKSPYTFTHVLNVRCTNEV